MGRDNPQWGVAVANLILWFGVFSYGFTHIFPHNKRGASHLFYLGSQRGGGLSREATSHQHTPEGRCSRPVPARFNHSCIGKGKSRTEGFRARRIGEGAGLNGIVARIPWRLV